MEEQSFGSCITMECNYDWKNTTSKTNESIKQRELRHCSNGPYQINNQKSNIEMKSKMKISRTQNGLLIPLLLCIVLVFFMTITVLVIMVIFLSTQRSTGKLSLPSNITFPYAHRLRQNLNEVNHFFFIFQFFIFPFLH